MIHVKPRLLVLELWGLGDLIIATPFLRAASEKFAVTLLAKPFATELRDRFWPGVEVIPFSAPWTVFHGKYRIWNWPWREMARLRQTLRARRFDFAVSGRWDPRDHWALKVSGARERLGFSRLKSRRFLTQALERPGPLAHRCEFWCEAGRALGLQVPDRMGLVTLPRAGARTVLLHSGARLPARVWPLENYRAIAGFFRKKNIPVQIACDRNQLAWWKENGENPACPQTVLELLKYIDQAGIFIGNCSGPGHLAAISGVPTFTLYGPSMHEWFVPMHPAAEVFEGRACPYKPCSDYCRYEKPFCLHEVKAEDVWPRVQAFADRHLNPAPTAAP